MMSTLVLAIALGVETPAAPSPDELAQLNRIFERARQVRVLTTTRAFDVTRPGASAAGLNYAATPGFPLRRPSIVAGDWDTISAPPRPVPWETIRQIEWRHGGTGTGVTAGIIGAGILFAGTAIAINGSGSDVGPSILGVALGSVAGGTLIGLVAAGIASRTEIVYRAR